MNLVFRRTICGQGSFSADLSASTSSADKGIKERRIRPHNLFKHHSSQAAYSSEADHSFLV